MLPNQLHSDNIGGPWQPQCWSEDSDQLMADARAQLFQDRSDITKGVLDGGDRALAGQDTAPQNETEQVIDSTTPGDAPSGSPRANAWTNNIKDLYRTEPLAAWASGAKDGKANPPA